MEVCEPLLKVNGCSKRELVEMMEVAGYRVRPMIGEMLCLPR
jgi:hypothetical protein